MIVWLQVVGVSLIAAGVALTFITALGMLRLGSLFARMHAATKPQVLGLVLMCAGLALVMQRSNVAATLLLVVMMQFFVAPISAHMLGRATYRLGQADHDAIVVDEYAEDVERARTRLSQEDSSDSPPAGSSAPGGSSVPGSSSVSGGSSVPGGSSD